MGLRGVNGNREYARTVHPYWVWRRDSRMVSRPALLEDGPTNTVRPRHVGHHGKAIRLGTGRGPACCRNHETQHTGSEKIMSEAERDPHFFGEITTFTYDPEGNLVSVEGTRAAGVEVGARRGEAALPDHPAGWQDRRVSRPAPRHFWSSPQIRKRAGWHQRRHGECPGSCICAGKRGCNG